MGYGGAALDASVPSQSIVAPSSLAYPLRVRVLVHTDLVVLRLRDIAERLRGWVHDVEQLDDRRAVVRDRHAALVVDQLIHAYTTTTGASRSEKNGEDERPFSSNGTVRTLPRFAAPGCRPPHATL